MTARAAPVDGRAFNLAHHAVGSCVILNSKSVGRVPKKRDVQAQKSETEYRYGRIRRPPVGVEPGTLQKQRGPSPSAASTVLCQHWAGPGRHTGPDRVRRVAQAILALSATHPAEPPEMPSSDSLMGLAGLIRGANRQLHRTTSGARQQTLVPRQREGNCCWNRVRFPQQAPQHSPAAAGPAH